MLIGNLVYAMIDISNYSVVSFDVFDTLLLRPYIEPQEVWEELEIRENAKGFARDRKKADRQAYDSCNAKGYDPDMNTVYSFIPQWEYMKRKEEELEIQLVCANQEMLDVWNEAGRLGKKRVILSDMYLSKRCIERMLLRCNIINWDSIYVSSEYKLSKSVGNLYSQMLSDMDVSAIDVVHIGDNEWSDVRQPAELGIASIRYKKISDEFFGVFPFAKKVDSKLAGALALGWHAFLYENKKVDYWHRFGFIIGGVLGYMYVSWIIDISQKIGINHLMFVGRDGYVLKKICNALYPDMATDYFFAPRIILRRWEHSRGTLDSDMMRASIERDIIDDSSAEEYISYLSQYDFGENTAIVDGCSSKFSAQRLVEKSLGRPVTSFYLHATSPLSKGYALFYTENEGLPFHMVSEFILCAPHSPVIDIKENVPVYDVNISDEEKFKMSKSESIAFAAIECAKYLHKYMSGSYIRSVWLDFFNSYFGNLQRDDQVYLTDAKNAVDVEQHEHLSILPRFQYDLIKIKNAEILSLKLSYDRNHVKKTYYVLGIIPVYRKKIKIMTVSPLN